MAYKQKFYGKKIGRSIALNESDKTVLGNLLQNFDDGQEMEMTFSKRKKIRTSGAPGEETNFNGYYWKYVLKTIGDEIGEMDLDYIHYWAQMKVGNYKVMKDGTKIPLGTSWMSGGEFADYCSRVRIWASKPGNITERGIYIPDPNETL